MSYTRYVDSTLSFFLEWLGPDFLAGLAAMCVLLLLLTAYGALQTAIGSYQEMKVLNDFKVELPPPQCPGCKTDISARLQSKNNDLLILFKSYQHYELTCKACLAVSEWDTMGLPTCLTWRPPTSEELRLAEEKADRRTRQEKIDELRVTIEKARIAKLRKY